MHKNKLKLRNYLTVLVIIVTLAFVSNESYSRNPIKKISYTDCFDQESGDLVAYSNNCIRGEGGCIDNGCPRGTAEQ